MKNNPQKKILRQDGFPIGAEMAKKRYSSAGTTTPFLKQLILTILLFAILPVTALAAEGAPGTLWVGQTQITANGYWKTNGDGTLTAEGASNSNYNVYYDGNGTLTLNSATIKGDNSPIGVPYGSGIYALSRSGQPVSLTIKLIGTNTITGNYGIYVDAEMSNDSYGTDASLTITGNGSLEVSGSSYGIWVKSGTGNASLIINDASVVATHTYSGYAGVCVQSSIRATGSPQLSLAVNGGSLTTSASEGNDGIQFIVGSSRATDATTNLTVTDNAIVDARTGGIRASDHKMSDLSDQIVVGSGTGTNGGIVFDGKSGTVYGDVTLQENLEIGEGESLTIPEGSSLDSNGKLTNEGTIINEGTLIGEVGGSGTVTPKITTDSLSDGTVGESYTAKLQATGNNITWSASGLPDGLTLNKNTGTISGTPTKEGTFNFTVTATNSAGNASKEYTLNIKSATVPVTGVTLDKTTLELFTGNTATLTATVQPSDATKKNVTWSSDNAYVATVGANGKVTAVGEGNATITVTTEDGSITATCTVTVAHTWGDVSYEWSKDDEGNQTCTATRTCEKDKTHTKSVTATVTSEPTKAPTCTEMGETTYTAEFDVVWASQQTKTIADIDATGHGETKIQNAKEPTCTADGYTGDKVCVVCDDVVEYGTVIPATGHDYENGYCTICGKKDPDYVEPEPEPEPEPTYYRVDLRPVEGATVILSADEVEEGGTLTFTIEIAEGYVADDLMVTVSQGIGKAVEVKPDEAGVYTVKEVDGLVTITVYGVTEEPATAIERVETLRIYAAEGILHVETPTRQRVTIVSMAGALIADGEQEGARIYRDLNAGVYIVRVGDYATKVRVE